jgi:hypothetical protein
MAMATVREWHVDPVAFERDYLKPIHRVGTITSTLIFLALFLPSIWLYFITGVFPDWQTILTGFGLAMTYAIPFYISEPIAYYPIVGNAGWYLCGTIGNGSNLRVPCAAVAQEVAGVKEGTMEGELVAAVGVTVSVFVSVPAIFFGALLINQIQQFFPAWLMDAFNRFLLPAVFGSVWGQFILRGWKYAPFAFVLALVPILYKVHSAWALVICVLGTMVVGWAMLRFLKIEA